MILYTCSYIPLEILMGTGKDFERLLSAASSSCHELGCNLCGYAKIVYGAGMELDKGDLLLVADSCDAMRRVGDLLSESSRAGVFMMRLPWKRDERAVEFMASEILRLIEFLEEKGIDVNLSAGVERFNGLIDHVRSLESTLVGRDLTELYLSALNGLKHDPTGSRVKNKTAGKDFGLAGGIVDMSEIDAIIESAGGVITRNDTCLGARPFASRTRVGEDPAFYVAQRLIGWRAPCGRFSEESEDECEGLDGLLYAIPKFCDFYDFTRNTSNSKIYRAEIDYPLNSHGQIATRVGALLEKNLARRSEIERGERSVFLGIDSGSTTTNGVLTDSTGKILRWKTIRTGINALASARRLYEELLSQSGGSKEEIARIVATGYGRELIDFADETVTEISCHARAVARLFPSAIGIVDIGGQDSKVIKLSAEGNVEDFSMNDRCAAGTGRFLEVMAKVLELDTGEMASLALRSSRELSISSVCTVFAESEVVSLIGRGEKIEDISAGLFNAIVKRVAAMYARLGSPEPLVFTGGVARNAGVVRSMERVLKRKITVPEVPDIMGAYGAALFAMDIPGEKGQ
ncbi:MAG: acyl-CoA dehydratase activase [Mesotoga sp.]|nr:acyl-CoA dehydratase activase [Mesotoga sp.]MDI9375659.1 acyl-CoA dehydratase activase [Thermotogota bacterium]HOY26359.1 acyl-CoA dehydratase activase [Mesotoga sp.]HPI16784.1 acyl-CoA dehydratase activase [Mesotoga sp.]